MQAQSIAASAAGELESYFRSGVYGHAAVVAQVLERLPSGEYAWLRSEERAEPDDALYVPTQSGRDLVARWRAQEALFGSLPNDGRVENLRRRVSLGAALHRDSTADVNCFTVPPTKN
jgi:hypothetical protein